MKPLRNVDSSKMQLLRHEWAPAHATPLLIHFYQLLAWAWHKELAMTFKALHLKDCYTAFLKSKAVYNVTKQVQHQNIHVQHQNKYIQYNSKYNKLKKTIQSIKIRKLILMIIIKYFWCKECQKIADPRCQMTYLLHYYTTITLFRCLVMNYAVYSKWNMNYCWMLLFLTAL